MVLQPLLFSWLHWRLLLPLLLLLLLLLFLSLLGRDCPPQSGAAKQRQQEKEEGREDRQRQPPRPVSSPSFPPGARHFILVAVLLPSFLASESPRVGHGHWAWESRGSQPAQADDRGFYVCAVWGVQGSIEKTL